MDAPTLYFDNAATTRPDQEVVEAMLPFLREHWGNASSLHHLGRPVAAAVHRARRTVAEAFGTRPTQVVFTSGATEANDLALRGAGGRAGGLVVSAVEHPAVLETARDLRADGRRVEIVGVKPSGALDLDALDAALHTRPALVSMMAVNNETGVCFPLDEIAARVHEAGALLHCDAVQAIGKWPVLLGEGGVDLLSISAHKFHGPKGVGALVLRPGLELRPTVPGGGQEGGRRGGTLNVPGIVGLGVALERAQRDQADDAAHMSALRKELERELAAAIPDLAITGADVERAPHVTHLTLPGVEAEAVLLQLDREGVACSVGSACSTGALEPSHVIRAMDLPRDRWHGALRFSLSRESTRGEVTALVRLLPAIVDRVRALGRSG